MATALGEHVSRGQISLMLAAFLAATFSAAALGGLFPPGEWYAGLVKPAWNPPNWLFGPVWTVLYLMIAVSGWLVWREAGFSGARTALLLFAVQLVLNATWSWVFFGLRRPDLAFAVIVLLELSILGLIALFRPFSMTASLLLVPYLLWVGFASVLNATLWRLNS